MNSVSTASSRALTVNDTTQLAVLERSGMIESRHLGAAVVLSPDGTELRRLGDPDALIYPRSTLKPMQAITVLRAGVTLNDEQLVLASASHTGSQRHQDVVASTLAAYGLTEDDLRCPPDWPADSATRRASDAPRRLAMNCSGKHASFLAACVVNDWPLESYLEHDHPLQERIRDTIVEFTGEPLAHEGTDGCGAPVFAMSLVSLATAIQRIVMADAATDAHAHSLVSAIRGNAWGLDMPQVAEAMDTLGIIAKRGAEGVLIAAAPDGTTVTLKILDGSIRPLLPVGLSLLADAGALDADAVASVLKSTTEQVLGRGLPVGELRFELA
ncbi:asparaginase [Salinibacterium amurskyense]|uniref:Asparaginase n=1 Tax=Salinibacterium amurskyense TaxID=205941 RepID=A0A2M9D1R2_9MICO|nr:asparaginase [Salinibacterium amurskyense]PJJ78087.1 asparaginase [Salinibacterium amurskyense]RLQ80239.1 asparaginase II [Salinibacterium amurskyense]GHD82503.1 asparaginase [Salinibacterium amurskyense]